MDKRRRWRMWWSGVFALAATGHLIRLLLGVRVLVGDVAIPLWVSGVIVPVAAGVSAWLMVISRQPPHCCHPRSPWNMAGGLHPKTLQKESARQPAPLYCGVHVGFGTLEEEEEDASED